MLLALCLEACRCGGPGLVEGEGGLRVAPERLAFGEVWRGADRRLSLSLTNTGRAATDVSFELAAPFSLANAPATVAGAAEQPLEVRFAPTTVGDFVGELAVTHDGVTTRVPLSGQGVEPPPCEPSLCRTARLEPESGACLQTPLADGTACASSCLVGACQAGTCVGTPRGCDDGDACTTDLCHAVEGCQHTPVRCAAAGPCSSPFCSADAGCVDAPAPDGTPCGPATCAEANVCIGGACVARQVPEGAPCGVESLCQPRGRCVAQRCDQPDASVIPREWSYASPSSNSIGLVGLVADPPGNLYTVECASIGGFGGGVFLAQCHALSFSPTGQLRWRTPFPRQSNTGLGSLSDALTVAGETLVSWVERSFVSAFELSTGAHRWTVDLRSLGAFPANSYVRIHSLAWDGGNRLTLAAESFAPSSAGSAVVVLELRTGAVLGLQVLPGQGFSLVQSRRGDTYVAHSVQGLQLREAVSAFDRTGAVQWQRVVPIGTTLRVRQLQATHQDQVLLTRREQLELVDTTSGALAKSGTLDGGVFSAPVWSDRRLFTIVQACATPPCRSFAEFEYRFTSIDPVSLAQHEAPLSRPFTFSPLWLTQRDAALFATWALPGVELNEYDAEARLLMRCPLELERLRQLGGGPVLTNGRYAMLTRRDGSSGAQQLDVWVLPGYRPATSGWVSPGGGPGHDGRAR